jgi:hypothetical protein
MIKTMYTKLISMLPASPDSAVLPPETLPTGKTLAYRARIGLAEIEQLIAHCTGEDPYDPKTDTDSLVNWKSVIVRDEDGAIVKEEYSETDADGKEHLKTRSLRRWVPVHFAGNRIPGADHIRTLTLRYARVGFQPAVRTFTFSWDGTLLDGQHGLISLWHYLNEYQVSHVDLDVKFVGKPKDEETAEAIFRLFDQALRRRTLKDALTTISGIPHGFEAELAGALRFATLIASGKGINSSRLQLPHILNDKGNPQKLEADDVAGFIGDGEPFHYYHTILLDILKSQSVHNDDKVPTLLHPSVTGSGLPNAQYYLAAFANFIYDPQNKLDYAKSIRKCIDFIEQIVLGVDSKSKAVVKLITARPKKAAEWLPIIERALQCFVAGQDAPRSWPKNLTFSGIVESYNLWLATNSPDTEETEAITDEDDDSELAEAYEDATEYEEIEV